MEYKRVKLTKVGLTGRIPDGLHPNGIEVGYIEEGYMVEPPKVGEMFFLYPHNKVAFGNTPIFHTSLVTEVISATEFRTLNSLYKIEVIWKN